MNSHLNGVESYIAQLEEQESRLTGQLEAAEKAFAEKTEPLRKELGRIQAGLAGLRGEAIRPGRKGRGVGENGVTREELADLLEALLAEKVPLSEPVLRQKVTSRVRELRKSAGGLHKRIGAVLKNDSRFVEESDGWRLSGEAATCN